VIDGRADPVPAPPAASSTDDPDNDDVRDEVPPSLIDHMEFYLFNYFKPGTYEQTPMTQRGRALMRQVGCTSCHIENLTIDRDRRVADVETTFDRERSVFKACSPTRRCSGTRKTIAPPSVAQATVG
jgi:hypothetical protein